MNYDDLGLRPKTYFYLKDDVSGDKIKLKEQEVYNK